MANDDVVLDIRVVPGASRDEILREDDGRVKVRLRAPPVEGKANKALQRLLASAFGVRARDVTIEHGETSRNKRVRITSPDRIPEVLR